MKVSIPDNIKKHIQKQINLAYAELNQIFNTAADGMRVVDKNFNVKRVNHTNEELLKRYQLLSEYARDIILFVQCDGRIIEANKAAIKAYGYERDELLKMTIFDLWADQTVPLVEIPLECRILSIVDAYDAMTSDRPYRSAMPVEKAVNELKRCAGVQFDTELVQMFIRVLGRGKK